MKKGIWFIVVLFILFAGCIGSPPKIENPLSSAPGMIMDYDKDASTTKIWVKGVTTDYKYSNITVIIDGTSTSDDNTYCLQCVTNLSSFSVQTVVRTESTCYEYACNVTVCELGLVDETYPLFTIIDSKHSDGISVFEKDLPFKRTLEEVKK